MDETDDPRTVTVADALGATAGDGLASHGGSTREPTAFNDGRARAAAREAGCHELNADPPRTTPIAAAAGCYRSPLVGATKIKKMKRALQPQPARLARSSQTPRSVTKCLNPRG
jgi:hypothetical protein